MERFTVRKRAFDLNTLQRVSLEREVEFEAVNSLEQALARVQGSKEKLLEVINRGLRAETIKYIRAQMTSSDPNILTNTKAIMAFVNNFRVLPQFAAIADRKDQTRAIFEFIKSNSVLLETLKQIAAAASEEEEEEEDNE